MSATKKAVLMILDGWGIAANPEVSAVDLGHTPFVDGLDRYPTAQLEASGRAVGLPEGQMGNSEVGHMNLGAGRVVYQDLVKIDLAIEEKAYFTTQSSSICWHRQKVNACTSWGWSQTEESTAISLT